MPNDLYSKLISKLCQKYIKKNLKVFDCGCGDGVHTSILKKYSKNVIGGDLDNRTRKEFNIPFRKIEIDSFGKENEFDIVTAFDVIEHVENDHSFLKELIRITKKGGIIIIGTPNKNRLSNKIRILIKGQIHYPRNLGYHYSSGGDIVHLREYTKDELLQLVENVSNIKKVEVISGFFGLYTFIGAIGFTGILKQKILSEYAQHIFIILVKKL